MYSGGAASDVLQQACMKEAGNDLQSLCRRGKLDKAFDVMVLLEQQDDAPAVSIYRSLLEECAKRKSLPLAKRIGAHLVNRGLLSNRALAEHTVRTFVKCGDLEYALKLFWRLPERTVFSWTAVISGFAISSKGKEVLVLYKLMQDEGVRPDPYVFASLLKACGSIGDLAEGRRIHAEVSKHRCDGDVFVRTALIHMYGKCKSIVDAQIVFDGLFQRDVVAWTALLAAYAQGGKPEKAMQLYLKMQEDGVSPNDRTFVMALQACGMLAEMEDEMIVDGHSVKVRSLERARAIHDDVRKKGYDLDPFVGNTLVSLYGKCGSIMDARLVFDGLSQTDIVSWNVMSTVYSQQSQPHKALHLYEQMRNKGMSPDDRTFVSVVQACAMLMEDEHALLVDCSLLKVKSLQRGKVLHADARRKGHELDPFFINTLVNLYGRCGSIADAQNMFDGLSDRSLVTWNALLAAYVAQGQPARAWQLYEEMCEKSVPLNDRTLVSILQACGMLAAEEDDTEVGQSNRAKYLEKGKAVHADAQMKGFGSDIFVGNTLVSFYVRCKSILDAQNAFDGLSERDIVSWTVMIGGYAQVGCPEKALQLFELIWEQGLSPNDRTLVSTLLACGMLAEKEQGMFVDGQCTKDKSLERGKFIHAEAHERGFGSDVFVANTLVSMYGKCGSIRDAEIVFEGLSGRDMVSWNAMIAAYTLQGQPEQALQLYDRMVENGVNPNKSIIVSALTACGMLVDKEGTGIEQPIKMKALEKLRAVHAEAQRHGCDSDLFVGSALISMYGKCKSIEDAENVFNGLTKGDVVVWNAMLAAYAEQGYPEKVLHIYEKMKTEGVSRDVRTFVSAIQACSMLADKEEPVVADGRGTKEQSLELGRAVHAEARRKGFCSDSFVGSTLICFYGKSGNLADARVVFDGLLHRDVVSWNSMIAAYVGQGQADVALHLYQCMQQEGIIPDEVTFLCTLQACSYTGSLDVCRQIHFNLASTGMDLCPVLATALINAYGKCSSMVDAQKVHDALPQPTLVSCNALIAGYARQGKCTASLKCYKEMVRAGLSPDGITFLSLLSACSYAGLLDKGVECFEAMSRDHGITPEIDHYVTMVDLLGRAGSFEMIQDLLSGMPLQPNLAIWLCLMGACRTHGKLLLAEQAFASAVRLQPTHASAYVLMSNIYADMGFSDRANEVKKLRLKEGARKEPGESWIDDGKGIRSFWAEDCKHDQHTELYNLLSLVGLGMEFNSASERRFGVDTVVRHSARAVWSC